MSPGDGVPAGLHIQHGPVRLRRPAVVRDAALIMVAEFFRKGVLYISFIIVARTLGVAGFGEFSALLGLGAILAVIVDFGLAELAVREMARRPESAASFLSRSRHLKLILAGFAAVATIAVVVVLGESLIALGVAVAYYVAASFAQLNVSRFRASHRMDLEVASRAFEFGLLLVLVLAAASLRLSVVQTLGLYVFSSASGLVMSHLLLRRIDKRDEARTDAPDMRSIAKTALPFALSLSLFLIYYRLNVVLLERMAGESVAGLFNAGYQLILGVLVLPIAISAASFPTFSRLHGPSFHHVLLRRAALLLGAGGMVAATTWFGAHWILSLLYGAEYAGAAAALRVLALALPVMFLTTLLAVGLQSQNRARVVSLVAAANFATALALNLLLIPRFGALGTASALLFTEILSAVWMGAALWAQGRKARPTRAVQDGSAEDASVNSQ